MKRKILSLILVLMLLPLASIFVACGKDDGYDLNNLKADYIKIAEENENITIRDNNIEFVYTTNVERIIKDTEPYTALKNYNYVFSNLMSFTKTHIDVCSSNDSTKNVDLKNDIAESLEAFKSSVKTVNTNMETFSEIIDVTVNSQGDIKSANCLIRFENLLVSYDELYKTASNLNNNLSKLYFNYILNDANPNVSEISVENFDANIVVNKLKSKIDYQISLLSQNFIEMYIDGGSLADKIVKGQIVFNLSQYNYYNNVTAINKSFVEATVAEIANNNANKQSFYNLAVQAYNIQETLFNDLDKFIQSINRISYSQVKNSTTATPIENMCADIIENNQVLLESYNNVLVQMLALMGV